MERKISFRAFDKIDNCIRAVREINFWEEWVAVEVFYGDSIGLEQRKFVDVILMESTGLKDAKGTEIYEGDIVEVVSYDLVKQYRIVKYCAPQFYLYKKLNDHVDVDTFDAPLASEVVAGNLYENPELLKDHQ